MMYLYCSLQYKYTIFINVSLYIYRLLIGDKGDATCTKSYRQWTELKRLELTGLDFTGLYYNTEGMASYRIDQLDSHIGLHVCHAHHALQMHHNTIKTKVT